ncbi:MAG: hypothetical protein V8T36_02420 [Ruthenibacterium lactatiformans]
MDDVLRLARDIGVQVVVVMPLVYRMPLYDTLCARRPFAPLRLISIVLPSRLYFAPRAQNARGGKNPFHFRANLL